MNSVHHKIPFIFFSIFTLAVLGGLGYFYFNKYTPNTNIFWVDASLKIKINSGGCPATFPCYENFSLDQDGNLYHNDSPAGRLSESKTKTIIKEAYNTYKDDICTPDENAGVTEEYELKIDSKTYNFGGKQGCKEMQGVIKTLQELINN
jgi:hypothetical protein